MAVIKEKCPSFKFIPLMFKEFGLTQMRKTHNQELKSNTQAIKKMFKSYYNRIIKSILRNIWFAFEDQNHVMLFKFLF